MVVINGFVNSGKHQNHACPNPQQYRNCLNEGTAQKEVKPIVFQHEPKDASIVLVSNAHLIVGLEKDTIASDQSREYRTTWSTISSNRGRRSMRDILHIVVVVRGILHGSSH
jgi:hypothetical protein